MPYLLGCHVRNFLWSTGKGLPSIQQAWLFSPAKTLLTERPILEYAEGLKKQEEARKWTAGVRTAYCATTVSVHLVGLSHQQICTVSGFWLRTLPKQ